MKRFLYVWAAMFLLACAAPGQTIDWEKQKTEILQHYRDVVRIDTSAPNETPAVEYLKTLAVVRMFLDNVENLESDWTTQGLKVLQMGLRFGANDVGSVQVERTRGATEEELRRVIRDAGFRTAQRELGYRAMMNV